MKNSFARRTFVLYLIVINLVVGCKNIEHYHSIVARLRSVPNVNDVARGYT